MGKAIIIKGADFTQGAVDKIGVNLVTEVVENEFYDRSNSVCKIEKLSSGSQMAANYCRTNLIPVTSGTTYQLSIPGYAGAKVRGIFYDSNNNNLTSYGVSISDTVVAPDKAATLGINMIINETTEGMTTISLEAAKGIRVVEKY